MHFRRNQDLTYWATGPSPRCSRSLAPLCGLAGSGEEPPKAGIFSERLPGFDQTLANEISGQVKAAGYATEFIGTSVLTNPDTTDRGELRFAGVAGRALVAHGGGASSHKLPAPGRRSAGAGAAGVAVAAVSDRGKLDVAGEL